MSLNFAYQFNPDLFPPAPVIPVTIILPNDMDNLEVSGLLDSGADSTLIRQSLANSLNLSKVNEADIAGISDAPGTSRTTAVYSIKLTIGDVYDDWTEVGGWQYLPEAELLIGRDILNDWYVQLRGPEFAGRIELTP